MKRLFLLGLSLIALSTLGWAQANYTVTASPATYAVGGGQLLLNVTLSYPANAVPRLEVKPPAATWAFVSAFGTDVPTILPRPGDTTVPSDPTSSFGFSYAEPPPTTASFSFVVSYPAGLTGAQVISLSGDYREGGTRPTVSVTPVTLQSGSGGNVPVITSASAVASTVGATFAGYTVTASNGPILFFSATGLPTGLSFNSVTGVISGSPTVAGTYPVSLTATNASGTSAVFTLSLAVFGATQEIVGATGYVAGGQITLKTTIIFGGDISSFGVTVTLPTGWSFASDTSTAQTKPLLNDLSVLDWNWTSVPTSPVTFNYTLNVPSSSTGSKTLTELLTIGVGAGQVQFLAKPDPLTISQITFHSIDTSGNLQIEGTELNRLIQLYNTRFTTADGKIRTGAYVVATPLGSTIDGFAPDSTRDPDATVTLTRYHSADTNLNGKIEGSELNRVIQLYNTRYTTADGKIRTGAYKLQAGTIDGFAPDPDRAPPP